MGKLSTMTANEMAELLGGAATNTDGKNFITYLTYRGYESTDNIDESTWLKLIEESNECTYVDHFVINANGIKQIKSFLAAKHKQKIFTDSMLAAWAEEAEYHRNESGAGLLEIKSWDSVSGHVEDFCVSDEGFDNPGTPVE